MPPLATTSPALTNFSAPAPRPRRVIARRCVVSDPPLPLLFLLTGQHGGANDLGARLTLLALNVSTISLPILAGLAAKGLGAPIQSDAKRAYQREADAAARQRKITGKAPPKQKPSKCGICHVTGHTAANKSFHP